MQWQWFGDFLTTLAIAVFFPVKVNDSLFSKYLPEFSDVRSK